MDTNVKQKKSKAGVLYFKSPLTPRDMGSGIHNAGFVSFKETKQIKIS